MIGNNHLCCGGGQIPEAYNPVAPRFIYATQRDPLNSDEEFYFVEGYDGGINPCAAGTHIEDSDGVYARKVPGTDTIEFRIGSRLPIINRQGEKDFSDTDAIEF